MQATHTQTHTGLEGAGHCGVLVDSIPTWFCLNRELRLSLFYAPILRPRAHILQYIFCTKLTNILPRPLSSIKASPRTSATGEHGEKADVHGGAVSGNGGLCDRTAACASGEDRR